MRNVTKNFYSEGGTEVKPAFLSSATGLKQSTLIIWEERHSSNRKKLKYIERQSNGVAFRKKNLNELSIV